MTKDRREGDKVADHTGPRSAVDLTTAYSYTNVQFTTVQSTLVALIRQNQAL